MAITQNNMSVAQSAMMGSILNDILLVQTRYSSLDVLTFVFLINTLISSANSI